MQIRSQLVSANRLKWIEEVRTQVSRFLSEKSRATRTLFEGKDNGDQLLVMRQSYEHLILLLNPTKPLHSDLIDAIGDSAIHMAKVSNEVAASKESPVNVYEIMEKNKPAEDAATAIHAPARAILKYEWERVKLGK